MTVLCCGDRNWTDRATIWRELRALGPGTVIVHGDARGADWLCDLAAKRLGYVVHPHPALWDEQGRSAGIRRNVTMLGAHPDIALVIAFHDALEASKGTRDMVERARAAGIPCRLVTTVGDVVLLDGARYSPDPGLF